MATNIGNQVATYNIGTSGIHFLNPNDTVLSGSSGIQNTTIANVEVIIAGSVLSDSSGIVFSSSADRNDVSVTSTGIVKGALWGIIWNGGNTADDGSISNAGDIAGLAVSGIATLGDNTTISNSGVVFGAEDGVRFYSQANNGGLSNSGSISGGDGVFVEGTDIRVLNVGTISGDASSPSGDGNGIAVTGSGFILRNSGTVGGTDRAFDGSSNRDVIYNSGAMEGDVVLGGGDDVYRGAGDAVVLGGVRGAAGDDDITGARASDYLDGGNGNDKIKGNEGADTLVGGNGRDLLFGGNDDDEIKGGNAGDLMLGGGGSDEFLFTNTGDIGTTSSTRDEIRDFEQGKDIIDLSAMIGPDFVFRGTSGFTGSSNPELRLVENGGSTFVQLDYDGDGSQDGRMLVRGVTGMTEDDFIL